MCISAADASFIRRRETNENSIQKFVVFTTQRSGSTWACEILDLQTSITCGTKKINGSIRKSELLKHHPMSYSSWDEFETSISTSLEAVETTAKSVPSSKPQAAGFKTMYARVEPTMMESQKMIDYFVKNKVAVIHLVREAKILRIASQSTMEKDKEKLAIKKPHTINKSEVEMVREQSAPFQWDETTISVIKNEERIDSEWENLLSFTPNLEYHRLIYEKMLTEDSLKEEISKILAFLNLDQVNEEDEQVKIDSQLLQLHKASCNGRVVNYSDFRKSIDGTRTAAACDYLDEVYGDEESELM